MAPTLQTLISTSARRAAADSVDADKDTLTKFFVMLPLPPQEITSHQTGRKQTRKDFHLSQQKKKKKITLNN